MSQDLSHDASHPLSAASVYAPGSIALLLPLSGRAAAAGEAVRDGFLSAYFAVDPTQRPPLHIIDSSKNPAASYQEAISQGASVVVGPLTKEEVAAVAPLANPRAITLALNVLPETSSAPARFYQFALAPEDEARQVVERLLAEGKRSGAALVPTGEWGRRVLDAFQAAFTSGGGQLVTTRTYAPGTTDYSSLIGDLVGFDDSRSRHKALVAALGTPLEFTPRRKEAVGFLFLAAQPVAGRLIRPQLKYHYAGELPVYALSDLYEPSPNANQDLDGVIFADMPWMLSEEAAITGAREDSQTLWSESTRRRSRLYALGADAFVLIGELKSPETFRDSVRGLTGRLSLDGSGRVHRVLDWAQIQPDGTIKPLPATGSP